MKLTVQVIAMVFSLALLSGLAYAQEKKGTVSAYDAKSRMLTVKGKDWEQKAKVSSKDADAKKNLLKDGTKVTVEYDDRGGGDVRVKSIMPR